MYFRILMVVAAAAAVSIVGAASLAKANDRCTAWQRQHDGNHWRICVHGARTQYCQLNKNGTVATVKC